MRKTKEKNAKEQDVLSVQVTPDLTVEVIPNEKHVFTMTSEQVAVGYGVKVDTIRRHKSDHQDELKEGKHYMKGVRKTHTLHNAQPNQIFWTKQGIIRLGFFIKSERAKQFRDWAEAYILSGGKGDNPFVKVQTDELGHVVLGKTSILTMQREGKIYYKLGHVEELLDHSQSIASVKQFVLNPKDGFLAKYPGLTNPTWFLSYEAILLMLRSSRKPKAMQVLAQFDKAHRNHMALQLVKHLSKVENVSEREELITGLFHLIQKR